MTTVSYPGVYVEEIAGGARPIEAAGTSTAAIVGVSEMGPVGMAIRVSSWNEYQRQFGIFVDGGRLAESVQAFFHNGGRQCDVVRIVRSDASRANVTLVNRAPTPTHGVVFEARSPGAWANSLLLTIEDGTGDPGNSFKLTVRRQKDPASVPADLAELPVLEEHDNLGMDGDSPNHFAARLERDSLVLRAAASTANTDLQAGFHLGEALSAAPGKPVATSRAFKISIDGDAYQTVQLDLPSAATFGWDELAAAIQAKVRQLLPGKTSIPGAAYSSFICAHETANGRTALRLTSGTTSSKFSAVLVQDAPENNIAGRLGLGPSRLSRSEGALARRRPARATAVQLGDASVNDPAVAAQPVAGSDGVAILGERDFAAGFVALDGRTDVSLLLVPGVGTPQMMDLGTAYCENRPLQDMFYIGEVGEFDDTPTLAETFRKSLTKVNSYGALYYPWVYATDPTGRSPRPVRQPPSGHIAGLFARIDGARGVWKAPAGTEAGLNGVVGLASELTDVEQGRLNPISVNALRKFSLSGLVSWGARTVHSNPEYKYVPVRRTAIMMRRSIYDGIQWAVFEPNDHRLWSSLRLNIEAFMNGLFSAGAFQGNKASDAYFVRCGLGDTMTQDDIDRGQVIVLVGFAPVKPAEFVIVRIQQKAGQQ